MENLASQESQWHNQLRVGKTNVTIHNIHIRSAVNDLGYITSVQGQVSNIFTELDETNEVLTVTLDVCIFPFDKYIRRELPLFKHMSPDKVSNRTIFKDQDKVHVRISHELTLESVLMDHSLNIPSVFLGVKCKDTCYRRCFQHGVPDPYIFAL